MPQLRNLILKGKTSFVLAELEDDVECLRGGVKLVRHEKFNAFFDRVLGVLIVLMFVSVFLDAMALAHLEHKLSFQTTNLFRAAASVLGFLILLHKFSDRNTFDEHLRRVECLATTFGTDVKDLVRMGKEEVKARAEKWMLSATRNVLVQSSNHKKALSRETDHVIESDRRTIAVNHELFKDMGLVKYLVALSHYYEQAQTDLDTLQAKAIEANKAKAELIRLQAFEVSVLEARKAEKPEAGGLSELVVHQDPTIPPPT